MREQHEKFRIEEVRFITDRWKSSESVSMIGIGSVGKSNLLQHLTHPIIYRNHLGLTEKQFQSVIIDPFLLGALPSDGNNVSQFTTWAGIELIMHRLYMTFFPFDFLNERDAEYLNGLYDLLQSGNNSLALYMGLRHLELTLKLLFNNGIKIVLMLDEFEEFLRIMPYRFFQMLRGLRDTYKSNLMFLTFSRNTFPILIEEYNIDYHKIEPFLELFTDNVIYVGPYNDGDAQYMIETLGNRNEHIRYNEQDNRFMLEATGKFAGLLRATYRLLHEIRDSITVDTDETLIYERLANKPAIQAECRTIWLSLSKTEREILKAVARLSVYKDSAIHEDAIRILIQKSLLIFHDNRLEIVPPLFSRYVYSNPQVDRK